MNDFKTMLQRAGVTLAENDPRIQMLSPEEADDAEIAHSDRIMELEKSERTKIWRLLASIGLADTESNKVTVDLNEQANEVSYEIVIGDPHDFTVGTVLQMMKAGVIIDETEISAYNQEISFETTFTATETVFANFVRKRI